MTVICKSPTRPFLDIYPPTMLLLIKQQQPQQEIGMFSHAADVFVLNHPRRPSLADLFMWVFFFLHVYLSICVSHRFFCFSRSSAGAHLPHSALSLPVPSLFWPHRAAVSGGERGRGAPGSSASLIIHRLSTPIAPLLPSSSTANIICSGKLC